MDKYALFLDCGSGYASVCLSKLSGLHAKNGYILMYVNFNPIRLI